MKRFFKVILFVIYLLIIIFTLLEIGVRFWGYSKRYIYDPIYMPFEKACDIPIIKPNLMNVRALGDIIINTDSLGLRSKIVGEKYDLKKSNEYRIAIIGDSVTFGYGIKRNEDIFPQVIEDILNQKQSIVKVKMFNYGVPSYSIKEMAATLKYRVSEVEPDLVLMAIIPEDFDLSRVSTIDKWGYFANKKRAGFISKNSFLKLIIRKIHLVYVLNDIRFRLFNKRWYIRDATLKDDLEESYKYIKQFKNILEEYKLPYTIVLLPDTIDSFGSCIIEKLEQDKVPFIDLSTVRNEFTLDQYIAMKYDLHPSARVHKRIGELLEEHIFNKYLNRVY